MHLLIRRHQRDDGWFESSVTFVLYAQLDLSPEELFLFEKYDLAERVVYNSEDFLKHLKAADDYREEAAKDDQDLVSIYYNSFAALGQNIMGTLSLQITLQSLIDGLQTESEDLEEILYIESLIQQSSQFVADYLKLALTFDSSEALHEY
jgi:hypothetical protein